MIRKALHTLAVFGVLFATWCLFSGIFTPFYLGLAIASCLLTTFITQRMEVMDHESHPFQLIYLGPWYWSWLAKEMVLSGLRVTWVVWAQEPNLQPRFSWVRLNLKSDLGRAIYANSLTLTPGTVCVDIEKDRAYIHALDAASIDALELGDIEKRVAKISAFAERKQGRS